MKLSVNVVEGHYENDEDIIEGYGAIIVARVKDLVAGVMPLVQQMVSNINPDDWSVGSDAELGNVYAPHTSGVRTNGLIVTPTVGVNSEGVSRILLSVQSNRPMLREQIVGEEINHLFLHAAKPQVSRWIEKALGEICEEFGLAGAAYIDTTYEVLKRI